MTPTSSLAAAYEKYRAEDNETVDPRLVPERLFAAGWKACAERAIEEVGTQVAEPFSPAMSAYGHCVDILRALLAPPTGEGEGEP